MLHYVGLTIFLKKLAITMSQHDTSQNVAAPSASESIVAGELRKVHVPIHIHRALTTMMRLHSMSTYHRVSFLLCNMVMNKFHTGHTVGTVPPEVFFAAVWELVGSLTRSSLTFHLGQLAKAVERGQNDSKLDVLAFLDRILLRAALRPYSSITYEGHGTPFVSMLRDASIGTLLEIKALAEKKMREDSDSMSWISTGSTDIPDGMIVEVPPNEGP